MTLMAHKFIDALLANEVADLPDDEKLKNELPKTLDVAHKFAFAAIPFERFVHESGDEAFLVPRMNEVEQQAWCDGLLPLPYPITWYEFDGVDSRSGLLVLGLRDLLLPTDNDWGDYELALLRVDRHEEEFSCDGVWRLVRSSNGIIETSSRGNRPFVSALAERHGVELVREMFDGECLTALYLTLMLNSRTTELRTETPPPKLNKARVKRGVTPLFEHRVVTIVPERYRRVALEEAGRTRLSPRLHWRRSHRRTLQSGKQVVVPRCLVGLAERGTVTHDYVVR